jgi:tetratricopeptide (TPR) repeat protein
MLLSSAKVRIGALVLNTIGTLVVLVAGGSCLYAAQSIAPAATAKLVCPQSSAEFARKHEAANRLFKKGNVAGALELYRRAYSLCPSDYQNAHDLALAEFLAGDSDKAKTLIAVLLQTQDRAELHSLLGRIESGARNYKVAAVQYQAAAQADASEENVFDYGTTLVRLDYGAAIKILRYGVDKYPDSVRLRVALGTALYAQGQSEEGAAMLCRAEELNPSDPHPMEILVSTEIVPPSLLERATSLLADLQRRYPKDGLILFDYTLVKSGRWSGDQDAMPVNFADSMRAVLALDPKLPQAYFQLALAYAQQGNYNDEIILLKKAIALSPEKEEYHFRLASAYRKTGNKPGFEEEIAKFQEIHKRQSANGN